MQLRVYSVQRVLVRVHAQASRERERICRITLLLLLIYLSSSLFSYFFSGFFRVVAAGLLQAYGNPQENFVYLVLVPQPGFHTYNSDQTCVHMSDRPCSQIRPPPDFFFGRHPQNRRWPLISSEVSMFSAARVPWRYCCRLSWSRSIRSSCSNARVKKYKKLKTPPCQLVLHFPCRLVLV